MTAQPTLSSHGAEIPIAGFGTSPLTGDVTPENVATALRVGYRHLDTGRKYGTERATGEGMRASGLPRKDIFLTTKIWVEHFTHDALLKQAEESAESLGTTPDLLLLHWPKPTPTFEETLGALNQAKDRGLTRNIGLSNFPSKEFRQAQALSKARLITNQVEHHPYLGVDALVATAAELGSSITAWSPLAQGKIADDATISEIAQAHGKTNGQATLRWLIQNRIIAIPRTTKESRARENFDIFDFELSGEEMQRMDALDRGERLGDWLDPAFEWDKTAA